MTDRLSKEQRSWVMSRVKGRNTKPEVVVRSTAHRMGYRFRLHRRDLPGSPDIVFPSRRKVIFVHGCFWHGHKGCRRSHRPTTHKAFWNLKLDGNAERDRRCKRELQRKGWTVLVVWECQTRKPEGLRAVLRRFLSDA